jgi:hypothetical protein
MNPAIKISQNFAIIKVLLESTVFFVENFAIQVQIVTKLNFFFFRCRKINANNVGDVSNVMKLSRTICI